MNKEFLINKVSRAIKEQVPEFIDRDHPQFVKFLEYYYKSQEKTGLSYNILNNLASYLNIDEYDFRLLEGGAYILEDVGPADDTIIVEDVYGFVERNGTIKIGDEIIFYEKATQSPNIAITDGIDYNSFRGRWVELVNPFFDFDSSTVRFPLLSGDQPISAPSARHLVVKVYNEYLIPNVDYEIDGNDIVFTQAPRTPTAADTVGDVSIFYLKGFSQSTITRIDSIQSQFDGIRKEFDLTTSSGVVVDAYTPVITEYTIVLLDKKLLIPNVDYSIYESTIIFKESPGSNRICNILSIEAPIPSFGSGSSAVAKIENGNLTKVLVKNSGSGYKIDNPPKVRVTGGSGFGATAIASVSGISKMRLLKGGKGYSESNPPKVLVEDPVSGKTAVINAEVVDGSVTTLELVDSGSGYTFTPRVTFADPGGATLSQPTVSGGQIVVSSVNVLSKGKYYTTPPLVYIDPPTGADPIQAQIITEIDELGQVTSVTVTNPGRGYVDAPRIAIIEPTLAQVLQVNVDGLGRVTGIDLLSGGLGFEDIPSIYIVDDRKDTVGNYIGGSGAKAVASIFNGSITDINITNFGTGYDPNNPPKVFIQRPPQAEASVDIAFDGVTGFTVIEPGRNYTKAQFEGCARGVAGPIGFDSIGNLVFQQASYATEHLVADAAKVDCLDGLFLKKMLSNFIDQFMPDLPYIDFAHVDVNNVIKNIRDFYGSKGTVQAIQYLFRILYGEEVSVSYPREQIIKPSDATWSVDTIIRAVVVSGNPEDLRDGLLIQEKDLVDPNVEAAQALIENYLTIETSSFTVYELILSAETILGKFAIPYKTRLVEGIGTDTGIITVDSTVGWPERNGSILVGDELVQYKEKSLNQFIECTRSRNGVVEDWDAGTIVKSNFRIYVNKGLQNEVQLEVLGIAEAGSTTLTDTGSYYLAGDKLTVAKLGATGSSPQLDSWRYNVKKLVGITEIQGAGRVATAYTDVDHGLLVGDRVTIYGANPIVYNGSFTVISINKDNRKEFQYLTQTDTGGIAPQGTILASIDLNKGRSDDAGIFNQIRLYTANIQNTFFNDDYVYVASTGLPNYKIGPFGESALVPGNQRKLNRFPLNVQTISTKTEIAPGPIGTFVNGVSVWSYKSEEKKTYGSITAIRLTNPGEDYDADSPPIMTITTPEGETGQSARATVVINGSITAIDVTNGGSGYTGIPLVSIVGGGGLGAAATAIVSQGKVTQVIVTNGGTGYTSRPIITISGGGGSGATAEAKVRGPIREAVITNPGSDYSAKPSISLSSGDGAVAQAIITNGRIISIAIVNAGSGYTTAPNVYIGGTGFGAVARAIIDTDGENAGRVTRIEILNKGIGYTQGTTTIDLVSVGSNAEFEADVFQWTYNLQEQVSTDAANGYVFSGYNNQYGGEYGHLSNPQRLRYVLGDNVVQNEAGTVLLESETGIEHSPIIGWAFDGNPIYGPYGYSDPTDQASEIQRVTTSYRLKTELVYNAITNPTPVRTDGPPLAQFAAGLFVEDYEYDFGNGDLDQYNGRFCKTPEYPDGTYAYFVTIDASENGIPRFPYIIGPAWNSIVDTWNLSRSAIQQNIPEGVIRYRDPFEDVDIDVERQPNVATDSLITEDGDLILFEPMDDDGNGAIDQYEIDTPNQLQEESKLELFDYFPQVSFDSRVDIEVETTTKFEDAKVDGFIVENPGRNYQVKDRLIFDNSGTDGDGASAEVRTIRGKEIQSFTFETINDVPHGVIQTTEPHTIEIGDNVEINYTPQLSDSNKKLKVRVIDGIERISVVQPGTGYNDDVPITVDIDGDGIDAVIEPIVNQTTGSITEFNIVNSGSGFTSDPRILISHPQVLKKTEYYLASIKNQGWTKINDIYVTEGKIAYVCGETKNSSGHICGFVAKYSATGVKQWEKTLSPSGPVTGSRSLRFNKLAYYDHKVYVVGEVYPNSTVQSAYNPDVILVRYDESADGLSASTGYQKGLAGISGAARGDYATTIRQYSDNRFIVGGWTTTNSSYPADAYIALVSLNGEFVTKRKISSENKSEKLVDVIVKGNFVYALLEVTPTLASTSTTFALAKLEVQSFGIELLWIKEYTQAANNFRDPAFTINEFDEIIITASLYDIAQAKTNAVWIGKYDIDGNLIWNYRNAVSDTDSVSISSAAIDIFGDVYVAVNKVDAATKEKLVDIYKYGYSGKVTRVSTTKLQNGADGFVVHGISADVSGDVYVTGQTYWNRNEFVLDFASNTLEDVTGAITDPTLASTNTSGEVATNRLKLYGVEQGTSTYAPTYLTFDETELQDAFGSGESWTFETFVFVPSTRYNNLSQTHHTLMAVTNDATQNGGVMLLIDVANRDLELYAANNTTALNAATPASSATSLVTLDRWHHVALTRSGDDFKVYLNGTQVISASSADVPTENRTLYVGNVPGITSVGVFDQSHQSSNTLDNIRLRNRLISSFTTPSDISSSTTENYVFTDTAFITAYTQKYDYIEYIGLTIKSDRNDDAIRLGTFPNLGSNFSGVEIVRSAGSQNLPTELILGSGVWNEGATGLQLLDFNNANTFHVVDEFSSVFANDIWSSRTATVPAPGSQKVRVDAKVIGKFFIKSSDTLKIDNIQKLTLNQEFVFTEKTKLVLRDDAGIFLNSGYIVSTDEANNIVYLAVNNNSWADDLNVGYLATEKFDEASTYGIVGPAPNDINLIQRYEFPQTINTTPGTFDIDMSTVSYLDGTLDEYAKFRIVDEEVNINYSLRIDDTVPSGSAYVRGSVIAIPSPESNIAFNNTDRTNITISGITGVLAVTLFATLEKKIKVSAVENTDDVYVITSNRHYLNAGDMIFVDGNPTQTIGNVDYDEYDGAFPVDTIVSSKEFTYKLGGVALTSPAVSAGSVEVYAKSPVIKMYYGHQYEFDVSHPSMAGYFLSFSKDNLNKLEYSFNSIIRTGVPGVVTTGSPVPKVLFKVTQPEITNISYYFDPSRVGEDAPVNPDAYLAVTYSPYIGEKTVAFLDGATITRGPDTFKFPLIDEPEGPANIVNASYETSSQKVVGEIGSIRIINSGGFYKKLPIVSDIVSTRKIERVNIIEPGTEYAVGVYEGIPISGDGEGGIVNITVSDGEDIEGNPIPGQISSVVILAPGKGYTTAFIDIEAIPGILGAGLTGSGAELEVEIPPFGTGASIFTRGTSVGKIKKLKNNNFGYDYPHDYTLRPEITFPINAQLINTSILDNITVTDPGSGYSQPPTVIIEGGGGSGAIAEATIKNGRIDQIIVKDPGAGYSSEPSVSLKSSFNYVVNLDLGLLQFSYPHGIQNGAAVQLQVQDDGDDEGAFPIAAGAIGTLNPSTTYYAISGIAQSLEPDQLKLAITPGNAELGDAISFVNAGTGRQILLTDSFGGAARANVITGQFLAGEEIYQGDDVNNPTATGYVSQNDGWLVGPRLLKLVDYNGTFNIGDKLTGKISKSSGVIASISVARGVLQIDSITKTTGQFIDDSGKLSEIIQRVQDSFYYQTFSYAVQSSVSIESWRRLLLTNVHPAGFKLFGQLQLSETTKIENRGTDFELTKSVNLADSAIVPNIQNFALVEPVYTQYNNTEVLFRQRRLTSSENILTSIVQRLDDISPLFDGERISFPLSVAQEPVSAAANQLMIVLNGVVQNPENSYTIQGSSIVFAEPPQPPASVKYANIEAQFLSVYRLEFENVSGIFPTLGFSIVGLTSRWRGTVISTSGNTIDVFFNGVSGENLPSLGGFQESEAVENGYIIGETFNVGATGFIGVLSSVTKLKDSAVTSDHLFEFKEKITNISGDTAVVEEINLSVGQERPLARIRYTIGLSTTNIEVVDYANVVDSPVPAGTFIENEYYQFGSEIFQITAITELESSTRLTVVRAQLGTTPSQQQDGTPIYGTQVNVTNTLTLSKTTGTYQSTPGLFDIQQYDVIVGLKSGVAVFVTRAFNYTDPVTSSVIPQVIISEGSTFFGLLFNRISNANYPNVVLDNIADSQIQIVDYETNLVGFDSNFPAGEFVNNYILEFANESGTILDDEYIRSYKFEYGNDSGPFSLNETAEVRKLAVKNKLGNGFFSNGQIIRSENAKAEVLGYAAGRGILYLGKTGRGSANGLDYIVPTFNGGAVISTAQRKFGSASLYCDGVNGSNVTIASYADTAFGTNAFTVDFWIRPAAASLTGTKNVIDCRSSGTDVAIRIYLDNGQVRYNVNGADIANSGGTVLSADTWHHVAVVRASGQSLLFIDGTQRGGGADSNSFTARAINIGGTLSSNYFEGYIDEVRVCTTNKYTADFDVPTGVHQGDSSTILLLHMEGENNGTSTIDWSGAAVWNEGDEFVNTGIAFRYYDAANEIENNLDLICAEAVYRTDRNFPRLHIPTTVISNRGADSYNLLLSNLDFIANEAYDRIAPTPPGGTTRTDCTDDVKDVIRNIAYNLKYGYNSKTWDAAEQYITGNVLQHLVGNEQDSVDVFNEARDIAKQVINNTTVTVSGAHGLTQTKDTSVTFVFGGCTDIEDAIDELMSIITDTILDPSGADAVTYPSSISQVTRTHPAHSRCITDLKITTVEILRDLRDGGNARTWDAAAFYVNRTLNPIQLNHVVGEEAETSWAYAMVATLAKEAMRGTSITIQGDHGLTQVIDSSITVDAAGAPYCTDVASAIDTLYGIVSDTIDEAYTNQVDHLATVTKVSAPFEYASATAYSSRTDSLVVRYVDGVNKYFWVNEIFGDDRYRYQDAANLIELNSEAIVDETSGRLLDYYPNLLTEMPRNQDGSGNGTSRCKTDLSLLLASIVKDLRFGGNFYSTEAAKFYLGQNDEIQFIRLQLYGSLYAHEQLGEMCKLAITGDLAASAQYTDAVIIPDIGITQDPGGCANVKTTIDNLIDNINTILSPTADRFADAANLIIFNRDYIAEEAVGLMEEEFFYTLSNGNRYQSFEYPGGSIDGRNKCIRDSKYIVEAIVADLLTGGNNSTLSAVEFYLNSALEISSVEDQLAATIYAYEQIAFLCKKAVNNLLQSSNNIQISADHYVAQYTQETAYTDLTITADPLTGSNQNASSCANVTTAIDNLTTSLVATLAPGGDTARSAAQVLLFNKNYYEKEIEQSVVNQWGAGSWTEGTFLDTLTDDIIHDIITTKESAITSQTTAEYTNTQTYKSIRELPSTVENLSQELNLIPVGAVEDFSTWTNPGNGSIAADADIAPDGTTTADKYIPDTVNGTAKNIERVFNLTAYTTFDIDTITLDSDAKTFDEGVDISFQRYTYSIFLKDGGYDKARIRLDWDLAHYVFFNIDLTSGTKGSTFTSGIDNVSADIIAQGNGWYRVYVSVDVPFGVNQLKLWIYGMNAASNPTGAGDGVNGVLFWGAKLAKGDIGIYESQAGTLFYPDDNYNIRKFAIDELERLMTSALTQTLIDPSPLTTFPAYTNSTLASEYTAADITAMVSYYCDLYRNQLLDSAYYVTVGVYNGITLQTKTYGTRNIPVPLGGEYSASAFAYGTSSDRFAELESYSLNEAQVATSFVRLTVSNITNGPFVLNDNAFKQGAPSVTGTVYALYEDENFSYVDMIVTAGPWAVGDVIATDEGASATIDAIDHRIHIIGLRGDFEDNVPFKAYTSNATATTTNFIRSEASVTSNTGGKLTVDTDSLIGPFETTSVVYPDTSRIYLDTNQYAGLEISIGQNIVSGGHVRLGVSTDGVLETFDVGGTIYGITAGTRNTNKRAIITEVDLDNGFIYVQPYLGTFVNGDAIGYFGPLDEEFPVGFAIIQTNTTIAGSASGRIVDIKTVGIGKRIFLADVRGTWTTRDTIVGRAGYAAQIDTIVELKARVKRAFRGFDGQQTIFKLTTANGTPYFPDPEGHMMIFVNGILQPPGALNAYTAFSDNIEFSEPPEVGASFTGFYVGKVRQLDDISFEFDSLRQSFNLRRGGTFYSLTLTDGVQSATVRPENNIIVSLNGVIQEPGVAFNIVGSRIIFAEVPRVGSTFVGFSYVGSEADVDAEVVVPPIEPGDIISIQGETTDREVAVIESSNSLITFDYLGSVFGKDAEATATITKGRITEARVTSGGSGYTSRPLVRVDSISGFDSNIKALVGVERVELTSKGSGYKYPTVVIESEVPDDWTAPNLDDYPADGTPSLVIDTLGTGSTGEGPVTEPSASLGVVDGTTTTSDPTLAGGGVVGQTSGGTDTQAGVSEDEETVVVPPTTAYTVSNFDITAIWANSTS